MPIPLYRYDGALIDWISPSRAERLFTAGDAKLVRHKKGTINRVILHRTPNETLPMRIADYMGKPYSYRQHLDGGQRCWRLKSLGDDRGESNLAPEEVRPIFLRVLLDCLKPGHEAPLDRAGAESRAVGGNIALTANVAPDVPTQAARWPASASV